MSQLIRMIRNAFVLAMLFAVCPGAKADRQPRRSLDEMEDLSSLIIDGTVISVADVGKKETKLSDGTSVFRIRRQALFEIQKVQKGQLNSKSGSVLLEYRKVDDARYKGEVAPDLKVNDRFRLYANAATIEQHDGLTTIFIHTRNAVRPEALKEVAPSTDTIREESHPSFVPRLPQSANPPPPPDAPTSRVEQPSDTPPSSTWWLVVVVAALGLLWLLLKKRK